MKPGNELLSGSCGAAQCRFCPAPAGASSKASKVGEAIGGDTKFNFQSTQSTPGRASFQPRSKTTLEEKI
jgi:hypothetical protein